ncbi:MAG: nucleoside-diphosphate-sugar epimerase [Halioglobus sp.]|jgi:nucleoside-diphosphate-sugar epimerase
MGEPISQATPQGPENLKIVITGGAGLVGQNLTSKLLDSGCQHLHVLDKSSHNLAIAESLHPAVKFTEANLADTGSWQDVFVGADVVVMLHAQIGGIVPEEFYRNNVTATENVLAVVPKTAYLVHVSSSVVDSVADDDYCRSKAQQEQLVVDSGLPYIVLRPTLMFGWFDRKHLGWLSQFMSLSPIFPIPGHGNYIRQPLYVGDFCEIIIAAIRNRPPSECFNISGKEKVGFIDILRMIKTATKSWSLLLRIPYWLFYVLLKIYAVFDRDPPFTTTQLQALVIDEVFEDIDWEGIFGVKATPLSQAIVDTFNHPRYSKIRLKF